MSQERKIVVDTVECKTLKIRGGKANLHASLNSRGFAAFLRQGQGDADDANIGLVCSDTQLYLQVYPTGGPRDSMPFAISTIGMQFPNPGNPKEVALLTFEELYDVARLVKAVDMEALVNAFAKEATEEKAA